MILSGVHTAGWSKMSVAVGAVLAAVAALVVALTRLPGRALDNAWAEDGTRFLTDAYRTTLPRALALTYSGYLHLYPRLAGAVAAAAAPVHAAAVLTVAGALTTAAAAAAIVVSARAVIDSLPLRLAVAVGVPLLPDAGSAVLGDVANAHVWLDLTALVLLFRPLAPRATEPDGSTRWVTTETVACWVAAALAAGSDPQALVLVPVAVGRWLLARRAGTRPARELVTVVVLAVGGLLQLLAVATHAVPTARTHPGVGTLARLYLRDVATSMLLGARRALGAGPLTLGVVGVLVLAVVAATLVRARARGLLAAALLACSVALWVAPPWLKWTPALAGHRGLTAEDARYTVLAAAVLLLALAGCADAALSRLPRPLLSGTAVVLALAVVAAFLWAPSLRVGPLRRPSWSAGVRAAAVDCRAHPSLQTAAVAGAPRTFHALVPCSRLR